MKSTLGQSEILVAVLFIILVSGAVIAQNATNITNITGALINGSQFENVTYNETPNVTKTIEASKIIQVYANSYLSLLINNTNPYQNETILLDAYLTLDNSSVLSNQWIDFYFDNISIGSSSTNTQGQSSLTLDLSIETPGTKTLKAEFSGLEFINPSYEEVQIDILSTENQTVFKPISYNPETDTITIVGNGTKCAEENPCGFVGIYEADQLGGWGQIKRISDSYYILNANLVIGDGDNETWFVYDWGEIWINKPWLIRGKSYVRFGHSELPLGCFIDANVSEDDLLKKESTIVVEKGASFHIYNSNFKVYHPTAKNNIYFEEGSDFESVRFSMQNVHDKERIPLLYAPENRTIEKMVAVKKNCIDSSEGFECKDVVKNEEENRFETKEELNESI
jgi:hypothetical protein